MPNLRCKVRGATLHRKHHRKVTYITICYIIGILLQLHHFKQHFNDVAGQSRAVFTSYLLKSAKSK